MYPLPRTKIRTVLLVAIFAAAPNLWAVENIPDGSYFTDNTEPIPPIGAWNLPPVCQSPQVTVTSFSDRKWWDDGPKGCGGGGWRYRPRMEAKYEFSIQCLNGLNYSGSLLQKAYQGLSNCYFNDSYRPAPHPWAAQSFDPNASENGRFSFRNPIQEIKDHWEGLPVQLPTLDPTQSGRMKNPLIIVPGWGSRPAHWGIGVPESEQWTNGLVHAYEYRSGSLPFVIAKMEGLNVNFDPSNPNAGINNNGIYAFQASSSHTNDVRWSSNFYDGSQPNTLYRSLYDVLDRHFGTTKNWRTDPTAQIDILCHSQGCLVVREMLANVASNASPSNPCNHIRKVISINSPHFGSPLADDPVPADHTDDLGALIQGMESTDQVLFSGEMDKSFVDYMKLMGRGGSQGVDMTTEFMSRHPEATGAVAILTFGTLPAAAIVGSWLAGAVMGGDADVTLEVKGGYMGPYSLKTVVQPEFLGFDAVDPMVSEINLSPTNTQGVDLLAIHNNGQHLGTQSPWIERLRNAGYPRRPDGTPLPFQVMWSSDVRGILGEVLSSLAGIVPNHCPQSEENPAVGCYAFNDFVWSQVKALTRSESNLDGDFTNRYFNPNFTGTLQKLSEKWMLKSDILVDESSQKFFSRADLQPDENAVFSDLRNYEIHRALTPNLPYSQVPHGPVKFNFSEMFGGMNIPLVLNHPGAAQEGMDLYCALDRSCNEMLASSHLPPLFPTGAPRSASVHSPVFMGTQGSVAGRVLSEQAPEPSLSGVARSIKLEGDLDLALVSQDGRLQGVRIPDADGNVIAVLAWTPEYGPWLQDRAGVHYLGTPGQSGRLLVRREGPYWWMGFATIDGAPVMTQVMAYNSNPIALDVVESEAQAQTYLVGSATPIDSASRHPANPGSVLVFHSETAGDARNVSRPRISVFNGTDKPLSGLKLRYFFTADPARNIQVRIATGQTFPVEVQYLGSGVNVATIDLAGQTVAPGDLLSSPGLELELRYSDWSNWLVFRDWSNNANYGLPKLNDRIQILDANGDALWGTPQPIPTVDAPVVAWGALVSSESRGSNTERRPRLVVANPGEATVVGPELRYFFRVPTGSTPSVSTYHVPKGRLWLAPYSGNVWTLNWSDSAGLLLPGAKMEVGDFAVRLTSGANLPETDTSLSYRAGPLGRNAHVLLFNRMGDTIWGQRPNLRPDTVPPPPDTTVRVGDVQVVAWDEGFHEANHPKPRLVLKNTGSHAIQNLVVRYFFAGDATKRPGLESDWYLPKCPATLIPSSTQWEVRLNCRDLNLMPGTVYPNESGMVFGLHWEGWTNWDRSLDWSGRLLGALPAANAHIVVEDVAGNRVWGDAP